MIETFLSGGVMMWPLLVIGAGVIVLSIRAAVRIAQARGGVPDITLSLQAILFWGVTSVVLGFLGMVVGIVIMAQAVVMAGAVETPLVWGGFGISLVTLVFGLFIFLFSSVAWFTLRHWHLRTAGRTR